MYMRCDSTPGLFEVLTRERQVGVEFVEHRVRGLGVSLSFRAQHPVLQGIAASDQGGEVTERGGTDDLVRREAYRSLLSHEYGNFS